MNLEDRIKRIEDELGITSRDADRALYYSFVEIYKAYGFNKTDAKRFAYHNMQTHRTAKAVECSLIRRGAVKVKPRYVKRVDDSVLFILRDNGLYSITSDSNQYTLENLMHPSMNGAFEIVKED